MGDFRSVCPACRGTKKTVGEIKCPWCFFDGSVSLEVAAVYWRVREASPYEHHTVFGARVMEDRANQRRGIPIVRATLIESEEDNEMEQIIALSDDAENCSVCGHTDHNDRTLSDGSKECPARVVGLKIESGSCVSGSDPGVVNGTS